MKIVNPEAIPGWENLNEEVLLHKGGTFETAKKKNEGIRKLKN